MTTPSNTIKTEPSPVSGKQTKTTETQASSTSAKRLNDAISLTELMHLISETLANFSEIQNGLARATDGFADMQNKALIEAAQNSLDKVVAALAAQKDAEQHAGIFKKIAMAFTIVVTVVMVLASAGTVTAALLPLAMCLLTTVKTSDGKGAFNFAVEGIVKALPEDCKNKELIASLIVTAAASLVGGAGSAALGAASVTATTVEVSSQVALDTGLPQDLGDATGKEWVTWVAMSLLMVTMLGAGMRSTQASFEANQASGQKPLIQQFSTLLAHYTGGEVGATEVLVQQMTRAIQTFSAAVAGSFQAATGAKTIEAAKEGYAAETANADLNQQHTIRSQANSSTNELQEDMMTLISTIYDQITSLLNTAGSDLEALTRQS